MRKPNRRLRAARALQGLTQADLAERINRSPSWVCELERGYIEPSDQDVSIICRVLRADASYLFPQEPVGNSLFEQVEVGE